MSRFFAKVLIVILLFTNSIITIGQVDLNYYLPEIEYDENIPTPEEILGYQVGEWHVTHGQLYLLMKTLCQESPNCFLTEYARSHEDKPLIYLTISSEKNIKNINKIKEEHVKLTDPTLPKAMDVSQMPIVIYQGYSIHGNESSGASAAILNAYYLLAGKSKKVKNLLANSVILLDPVYNPDGLQRFSTWANSHKHKHLVSDTRSREFNEVWPGGRTNHYWFDLNRDWLFNIHPSSKGRIKTFHEWKPDILTDHHEMGSNSTFFFQPGIPSRTNPNTPQINQDLTEEIGTYHASFLDSIGSMYYTKESFDDFYYGKGSTYPDINGCIGILFEQASTRGHLRETTNGLMSFPFTIRNQMVTSLSTQEAAIQLRQDILNFKQDFFRKRYHGTNTKGYFIFESKDHYKSQFFLDLLNRHKVDVYKTSKDIKIKNRKFNPDFSYIIPKKQKQTTLIKTIFESVKTFNDSLFYDVSAWTIPLALDIKYGESFSDLDYGNLTKTTTARTIKNNIVTKEKSFALALDWSNFMAPNHLYKLLEKDINVKVLTQPTRLKTEDGYKDFNQGTIIVPLANQPMPKNELVNLVKDNSATNNQSVDVIQTGFSRDGFSLGSPKQNDIELPSVAMIIGEGINAYEAGDNWYQFDFRLDMPLTMIDKRQMNGTDLNKYNVIILPDGTYNKDDRMSSKIINWVDKGGTIIALRRAISYTQSLGLTSKLTPKKVKTKEEKPSYKGYTKSRGAQVIGGAILNSEIDLSHPLFFGYSNSTLPVFKRGTQFYEVMNSLATPLVYTSDPMLSGYSSSENLQKAKNAAGVMCYAYGNGRIIAMVDNPNFRGYWLGGSKLFANAIFFSKLIQGGTLMR